MKNSQLKIFLFFFMLLLVAAALFADGELAELGLGGMEKFGNTVKAIFTGTLVRVILTCCLAGCAIAYGFNKDNEKMKRNVIAIAVAVAIIAAASFIVDSLFNAAK